MSKKLPVEEVKSRSEVVLRKAQIRKGMQERQDSRIVVVMAAHVKMPNIFLFQSVVCIFANT